MVAQWDGHPIIHLPSHSTNKSQSCFISKVCKQGREIRIMGRERDYRPIIQSL